MACSLSRVDGRCYGPQYRAQTRHQCHGAAPGALSKNKSPSVTFGFFGNVKLGDYSSVPTRQNCPALVPRFADCPLSSTISGMGALLFCPSSVQNNLRKIWRFAESSWKVLRTSSFAEIEILRRSFWTKLGRRGRLPCPRLCWTMFCHVGPVQINPQV